MNEMPVEVEVPEGDWSDIPQGEDWYEEWASAPWEDNE